jgi:tight adherence protein B
MIGVVYTILFLSMTGSLTVGWICYLEFVQQSAVTRRVDSLLRGPAHPGAPAPVGAIERVRLRFAQAIRRGFTIGLSRTWGMRCSLPVLLIAGVAAALGASLLAYITLRPPSVVTALAGVAVFFLAPRMLLLRDQHKADAQFNELLPDAIDMVVRMVRAGLPVAAAIRAVASETDWPANHIFRDVADMAEIGVPLSEALGRTGMTVASPDFRFFGVAVALQQATGGNLAATLETLSEIIRKRRAVRLKARAATAEIRMSALVLAAIPFFIVGALLIVSPGYLEPLISDPRGNIIIGSSVLSLILAAVTMRGMMRAAVRG